MHGWWEREDSWDLIGGTDNKRGGGGGGGRGKEGVNGWMRSERGGWTMGVDWRRVDGCMDGEERLVSARIRKVSLSVCHSSIRTCHWLVKC